MSNRFSRRAPVESLEPRRLFAIEYVFVDLGIAPNAIGSFGPQGISGDGSVVLGVGIPNSSSRNSHTWTAAGGWQFRGSGGMSDADADGSTIVGTTNANIAFRVADGTTSSLGTFAGGLTSNAAAVNADGTVIVGSGANAANGTEAWRWTASGGMQSLGDLAGGRVQGIANDVSGDGSVVVGSGTISSSGSTGFRWTSATGMVALPDLPGGFVFAAANAVSDDGNVIVGTGADADSTYVPVVWDAAGNITRLDATFGGQPKDVTGDGQIIVGNGGDSTSSFGVRWRGGAQANLNTITSGIPSGQSIMDAVAIANDGGAILVRTEDAAFVSRVGLLQPLFASVTSRVLTIAGTGGNDVITFAVSGSNVTVTRSGTPQSFALADFDKLEVQAGNGNDRVDLGAFNKPAYLSGGSGADTLVGGESNDTILGGGGGDRIYGRGGNDRLRGSGSRDFIYGEAGDDRVEGEDGDDYLDGGGNKDRAYGGDGNDSIIGGASVDRLYGDIGNDSFIGGPGNDYLFGGLGTDRTRVPDAGDILDSVEESG